MMPGPGLRAHRGASGHPETGGTMPSCQSPAIANPSAEGRGRVFRKCRCGLAVGCPDDLEAVKAECPCSCARSSVHPPKPRRRVLILGLAHSRVSPDDLSTKVVAHAIRGRVLAYGELSVRRNLCFSPVIREESLNFWAVTLALYRRLKPSRHASGRDPEKRPAHGAPTEWIPSIPRVILSRNLRGAQFATLVWREP
jgi:hypothetical protein